MPRMPSKHTPGPCYYCGREPAQATQVYEPSDTQDDVYAAVVRVVCATCAREYERPPWGFPVEGE